MRRPAIQSYTASNWNYFISCMGDSLSSPANGPVGLNEMWPQVLGRKLRKAGCSVSCRDVARDGTKTDNLTVGMMARSRELCFPYVPQIGIVWGGTNDQRPLSALTSSSTTATATSVAHGFSAGAKISIIGANQPEYNVTNVAIATVPDADTFTYSFAGSATSPATGTLIQGVLQTVVNLRSLILSMKFNSAGAVQNPSNLPALTAIGTRYVVLEDNSTTGGIALTALIYDPTITGTLVGSPPSVWECRNRNGGETGWSRVFISSSRPTHCTKFLIAGQHYLNWSSASSTAGGDSVGGGIIYQPYLQIRNRQSSVPALERGDGSAGAAEVIYVDNYAYFSGLISSGLETQASFSWHTADSNIHLNQLGHNYLAESVFAAIPTGWYPLITKS